MTRLPGGMAVLNSVPTANPIYKDVFTSVFNRSFLLDLRFLVHGVQQDAFYFVKPDTWRASDDRGQLKRLGSQVNTSFHEKDQEMADIKIHNSGTVINLRSVLTYFYPIVKENSMEPVYFVLNVFSICNFYKLIITKVVFCHVLDYFFNEMYLLTSETFSEY